MRSGVIAWLCARNADCAQADGAPCGGPPVERRLWRRKYGGEAGLSSESAEDRLRRSPTASSLPAFDVLGDLGLFAAANSPKPLQDLVVIVHGTFANPTFGSSSGGRPTYWWDSYGSFGKALDAALERQGSTARCGSPDAWGFASWRENRPYWHGWSGANSEVERRRGAFELAEYLRGLQEEDTIGTIHVVAHSHGGNVVRRALRYMKKPTDKLGKVICLGTPFLEFNDRAAWRRWLARVHWPMLIVLAGLGATLVHFEQWLTQTNDQVALYVVVGLVFATAISIWRYARSAEGNANVMPMTLLRFANDEAIQLLRSCAELTAAPHVFLRDMLGGTVPPRDRFLPDRPPPSSSGWFDRMRNAIAATGRFFGNCALAVSDFWNRRVAHAAEGTTTRAFRVPVVGGMLGTTSTLLLILLFRPYRPRLLPFLTSRMPRLRALFFHSADESFQRRRDEALASPPPVRRFLVGSVALASGAERAQSKNWLDTAKSAFRTTIFHPESLQEVVSVFPVLVYWFVLFPIDVVLGLPAWLGAALTRLAILVGLRSAAASAPGMDMLGAAFDPRRTSTAPAGVTEVTVPEHIEKSVENRLAAANRIDFAGLRASIDPARRATLLKAIETTFTEVGLLHAQYYQDANVIDYIAALIAGGGEPRWPDILPEGEAADRSTRA